MAAPSRNPWDTGDDDIPAPVQTPTGAGPRPTRTLANPWDTTPGEIRTSDRRRRTTREQYESQNPPGMRRVLDRAEVLASRLPIVGNFVPRSETSRQFEQGMTPSENVAAGVISNVVPMGLASRAVSAIPLPYLRNPTTGRIAFNPATNRPATDPSAGTRMRVGEVAGPDKISQATLGGGVTAADIATAENRPGALQSAAHTALGTAGGMIGARASRLGSPRGMRFNRAEPELPPISANPAAGLPSLAPPATPPFPVYTPERQFGRRAQRPNPPWNRFDSNRLQDELATQLHTDMSRMGRTGPPPLPNSPANQTPIPQSGNIGPTVQGVRDRMQLENAPASTARTAQTGVDTAEVAANAPGRMSQAVDVIADSALPVLGGAASYYLHGHPAAGPVGYAATAYGRHRLRQAARRWGDETPSGRRFMALPPINPNTAAASRAVPLSAGPFINDQLPPILGYE